AQPLVAWARPEFWWLQGLLTDDAITIATQSLAWAKQTVSEAGTHKGGSLGNGPVQPQSSGNASSNEPIPEPETRTLWVSGRRAEEVDSDFDGWAQRYRSLYDEQLVAEQPTWALLEQKAGAGLAAARAPALRYSLSVRYCASMYFRPPTDSS